jgi:hypothetical protein
MKTLLVRSVLVESKEVTNLWSYKGRRLYYDQANFNDEDETIYYQLILISLDPDEKIEEGDLKYGCGRLEKQDAFRYENTTIIGTIIWRKVIATQDQLSPELINQLVSEYNNGGMQDFEIEMFHDWSTEIEHGLDPITDSTFTVKPKLTNGFVYVAENPVFGILNDPKVNGVDYENTPVPDYPPIYTEDEVNLLFHKYLDDHSVLNTHRNHAIMDVWFNENKKK